MAHIEEADYETITATCDHCHARNVFHRISDIGKPGPYVGRDITCLSCGRDFRVTADTWMPAYQFFIFAADEHARRKRFMPAALSLGQAWEIFFATYLYSNYLYRPFFAPPPERRSALLLTPLAEQLNELIELFAFTKLRNMFVRTILRGWHPQDLGESYPALARLRTEKIWKKLQLPEVLQHQDPTERGLLEAVMNLQIDGLRNRVVHKEAYRPTEEELTTCRENEVRLLYRLKLTFRVADFQEIAAGAA